MLALVALLLVAGNEPPADLSPTYDADAASLRRVGAREMFLPIRACFRQMATEHRARTSAIGSKAAAAAFMHRALDSCGYHAGAARLLGELRRADPSASARILRRRAEVELLPVRVEAKMWAEQAVRMAPPPPPTMTFDCPGRDCPLPRSSPAPAADDGGPHIIRDMGMPPPSTADLALDDYGDCLWKSAHSGRGAGSIAPARARAVFRGAIRACRALRAAALTEMLKEAYSASQARQAVDSREGLIVESLQQPKAPDAPN
jgi:hypothetical protein